VRALRLIVNDIARAMRRSGLAYLKNAKYNEHFLCDRVMGRDLLKYAAMLTNATKRQTTKTKTLARGRTMEIRAGRRTASERGR
jgi:hypothetical protein